MGEDVIIYTICIAYALLSTGSFILGVHFCNKIHASKPKSAPQVGAVAGGYTEYDAYVPGKEEEEDK